MDLISSLRNVFIVCEIQTKRGVGLLFKEPIPRKILYVKSSLDLV